MHGGASPLALASPNYKHGRYSKYLPDRLLPRYYEMREDQALLELKEEIALLDTRIAELVGRLDRGESGGAWGRIAGAWEEASTALVLNDQRQFKRAWGQLGLIIEAGNTDYAGWQEIQSFVEQRRRLAESERKRNIEMQTTIRLDQAMVLVTALVSSVRNHVSDPSILSAIEQDILRIVGTADGEGVSAHSSSGAEKPATPA